jgi:CubicO group peptidase (beta-lactamase class C family)
MSPFIAMINRYLLSVLFTILIPLLCSCSSIPKPPDKVESISELENYLNKVAESGTPPGMSLAVVKNDSIIYSKGFGWADEPREIHASANTVYHWWSCTKIATAISILQLQEKGKLSLNDPVVNYLPFFKVEYPSDTSKEITILNLLNHTSGLPDPSVITFINWIHHDGEPPLNQTDFLQQVLPDYSKLMFEPGDHAEYSNIGYMVLGAVIEKVTGMVYEDYIRQNILHPLGMHHTEFLYMKSTEQDEAAGAHSTFSLMTPLLLILAGSYVRELDWSHIWMERVYTDQTPSTGLIGSVTDAARLAAAYLNGGKLNGQRILSQESITTMTYEGQIKAKNEDSLNYQRQGICWQIYGRSGRWVLTHEGGGPGFSTKFQLYPDEKLGFILFTNDATIETWKIINLAAILNW